MYIFYFTYFLINRRQDVVFVCMSKVFEGVFLQGTFTARAVKRTICKRDGHVDEENYSEAN